MHLTSGRRKVTEQHTESIAFGIILALIPAIDISGKVAASLALAAAVTRRITSLPVPCTGTAHQESLRLTGEPLCLLFRTEEKEKAAGECNYSCTDNRARTTTEPTEKMLNSEPTREIVCSAGGRGGRNAFSDDKYCRGELKFSM